MTLWAFLPVLSLHILSSLQKILSILNNSALEGSSPLTDWPGSWEVCLFIFCGEEKKKQTPFPPSVSAAVWQSGLAHVLNSIWDLQFTVCAALVSSSVKGRSQYPWQRVTVTTISDKGNNSPNCCLALSSARDSKRLRHTLASPLLSPTPSLLKDASKCIHFHLIPPLSAEISVLSTLNRLILMEDFYIVTQRKK